MNVSRLPGITVLVLIATASAGAARAQTGGGYDLHWNTHSGGGAAMAGAGYTLAGTIGVVAAESMQGNEGRVLRGGFWAGLHDPSDAIFQSGFESSP